jgi:hypothetical protein
MLASYPMLNLLMNHSLGIAIFSYDARLHWGLMADWDLVPDLHDFLGHLEASFRELAEAAGVEVAHPRPAEREADEERETEPERELEAQPQ